ncbi:hypothetical protein K0A97_02635 [Patescibacteria group bacterium]|nr:hypothetical protein [Patescibacteria group bacterium]
MNPRIKEFKKDFSNQRCLGEGTYKKSGAGLLIIITLFFLIISLITPSGEGSTNSGGIEIDISTNVSVLDFGAESIKITWSIEINQSANPWGELDQTFFRVFCPDETVLINESYNDQSSGELSFSPEELTVVGIYEIKINANVTTGESEEKTITFEVLAEEEEEEEEEETESEEEYEIEVSLISPSQNSRFKVSEVNLSFLVESEEEVDKCIIEIFRLENMTGSSISSGNLFKKEVLKDVDVDKTITKKISGLVRGKYFWYVTCSDDIKENSSLTKIFYVDSSYEREEEVEELLEAMNNFLEKEKSFNIETKKVVKELGIIEEISSHKKKLLQMRIDLKNNFQYIAGEIRREERKKEINEFLDYLIENLPTSVEVIQSEEYTKNVLSQEISDVIKGYIHAKNIILNSRSTNRLIKDNEELQHKISVLTKTRKVKIDYFDDNEKRFILVTKEISLKENLTDYLIIEKIPKQIDITKDVSFLGKNPEILEEESLILIKKQDLTNSTFSYSIEDLEDIKKIEMTETVIFAEKIIETKARNILTGFSSFIDNFGGFETEDFWFYFRWILFGGFLLVASIFGYNEIKYTLIPNSEETKKIMGLIQDAYRSLDSCEKIKGAKERELEIMRSKKNYYLATKIYPELGEDSRAYVYDKMLKLRRLINEKEVYYTVEECIEKLRDGKKEGAIDIYKRIKGLYPKISEEAKETIFSKIEPYLDFLKEN